MSKLQQSFLIHYITKSTTAHNIDNISRTKAYQTYYEKHPEIVWTLIATVVSRNAGYNMTDLTLPTYKKMLGREEREYLFQTYERANWTIFSDAYPQLLVYELSKEFQTPLFPLLVHFQVSRFMIKEWHYFWKTNDKERLMLALIINEQNVIEHPLITKSKYEKEVFHRLPYRIINVLWMNAVLIPAMHQSSYGVFIHHFTSLNRRIKTGRRIATMLSDPKIYKNTVDFIRTIKPTGSRFEYERFRKRKFTSEISQPYRQLYPIVQHQDTIRKDWSKRKGVHKKWLTPLTVSQYSPIENQFNFKRKLLYLYGKLHI
ncbi:DUF2515 domain-containing protein [Oceanobacillus sp. 1P07AA]|uniref:DUF2515 domain-containing protein n=1 Tax=Oceanobacillus sp. 1P07AA TaxID=3132293 RepID=UPI0039A56EFB